MQAQCRAERSTDIGFVATSYLVGNKSLGGKSQRAGDDGECGYEVADDGVDGKVINTEHSQDDTGSVKVNNQHKRRTQVQRYCVAGQ